MYERERKETERRAGEDDCLSCFVLLVLKKAREIKCADVICRRVLGVEEWVQGSCVVGGGKGRDARGGEWGERGGEV